MKFDPFSRLLREITLVKCIILDQSHKCANVLILLKVTYYCKRPDIYNHYNKNYVN